MKFFIKNMCEEYAVQILKWNYDTPYDFYNNEVNSDSIKEMLENPYCVVVDEYEKLVGFFCTGALAQVPIGSRFGAYSEDFIDIGIGMKPVLTGQGLGYMFFSFVLHHIQETNKDVSIRLTVAKFNKRAIHLYEKVGFKEEMEFSNGKADFQTMVKI
ncbi:GNAT family N-acetyltransferase [Cytobacillus dafuensis]|uniref:GNAT family N-acetyltransferase n=1 Tax=Cytobacillus dafuensis TaxID=1742359 RepID=A0A5B8Z0A6_CYTDA|nr:GNAT family N-acetyltransferase [Cytobacillus dafuensis]QED46181.1 GNAT family N-acetyltransferase [Cytobacillus dafuensis]